MNFYLDYPEGSELKEEDIIWLCRQLYRNGYEDVISKIKNAARDVEKEVDKKYEAYMDC